MAPELKGVEDVAGAEVEVWAPEELVLEDVDVDVEPVDEDDIPVDVDEGADEADEPTRPFAVKLT
jgi:hypothetical protein